MYGFLFVAVLTATFLVFGTVCVFFPKTLEAFDKKLSDFIGGAEK